MCECGCGEMRAVGTFAGPGGDVYALEIYPGCGDCHVGPGVVVHRFTAAEAVEMLEDVPALPWLTSPRQVAVPVLSERAIREAIDRELGEDEADVLGLNIELFRHAVAATLAEWRTDIDA